jgi:hypothetical protein
MGVRCLNSARSQSVVLQLTSCYTMATAMGETIRSYESQSQGAVSYQHLVIRMMLAVWNVHESLAGENRSIGRQYSSSATYLPQVSHKFPLNWTRGSRSEERARNRPRLSAYMARMMKYLRNVGQFLWDYTVQHPRKQAIFILDTGRTWNLIL